MTEDEEKDTRWSMKSMTYRNVLYCVVVVAIVFGVLFLVTGCSTVSTRTLEYCETENQRFLFIPFNINQECIGVSVDGAQGSVELPLRES